MKAVFRILPCLMVPGCIWSPTNRTDRESTDVVWLYGEAGAANQTIEFTARNHRTRSTVIVGTTTSASSADSYGLFPWVATITPAADFWAPQLARGLAHAPGRLEIVARVRGDSMPFRTFSETARSCALGQMAAGQSAVAAGNACSDGSSLVVFDSNGVGNSTSGPAATAWIADTPFHSVNTVPPGIPGGVPAQWQIGHYAMRSTDDPSGAIDVYGVICRPIPGPTTPARLKTAIINHGGYGGVESILLSTCLSAAHAGWLAAASAYRFEGVNVPARPPPDASPAVVRPADPSRVEVALGEVADVLRLTEIVRARADVDTSRVLMWGHSHGGAITLRAVQLGAKVAAAAAFAPPTDFIAWWNYCAMGPVVGAGCATTDDDLTRALGGTPAALPIAYQWRSATHFASDLTVRDDVKVLILQGDQDALIHPSQACGLARAAWAVPSKPYRARFLGGAAVPPADCAGAGLAWEYGAPTAWPENRNVHVYAGADHGSILSGAPWQHFESFVRAAIPQLP